MLQNNSVALNFIFKPNLKLEEKGIAHLAYTKQLRDAINKIKKDESDWKKIFIQYKSRVEKKRNWREKQKLYKQIEENLEKIKEESGSEDEIEENNEDDDTKAENGQTDEDKKEPDLEKVEKSIDKKALKTNKTHTDIDVIDDDKDVDNVDSADDVVFSDSDTLTDQNENSQSAESLVNDTPLNDSNQNTKNETSNKNIWLETPILSKEMVIKRINLNELKNLDEIPIERNESTNDDEDDLMNLLTKNSEKKSEKRVKDPFFLGENGEEISEDEDTRKMASRSYGNIDDRDDDRFFNGGYHRDNYERRQNYNGYSNRDFDRRDNYKKRSFTESSFTNSLNHTNRFPDKRTKFNSNDKTDKKFSNEKFNKNMDYNKDRKPFQRDESFKSKRRKIILSLK